MRFMERARWGIAALALMSGTQAMAAIIFVNSTADDVAANGNCTLREAIITANTNAVVDGCVRSNNAGDDIIFLSAGTYTLSIAGRGEEAAATGDLDITESLSLFGFDTTNTVIDGGGVDRILHVVSPTATITVGGLTLRNGDPGDALGGAIQNLGNLSLANVRVTASLAASGGGIHNQRTLTTTDATVDGNSTVDLGSTAPRGAGLSNAAGATAVLSRSTFSGNMTATSATADGGGIFNAGTLNVVNSTLSGNQASNGSGGAMANDAGVVNLNNATVASNTATGTGDGIANLAGSVTTANSIIAGNTSDNCAGQITSAGYNLDSGASCGVAGTGDLAGVNPLLGVLANNGGPTQTHALQSGSPAINAGNPGGCRDSNGAALTTDQTGRVRPEAAGGRCDIGAYEVPAASSSSSGGGGGGGGAIDWLMLLTLFAVVLLDPYRKKYRGHTTNRAF